MAAFLVVLLTFLLILFAFVDVWYFVRFLHYLQMFCDIFFYGKRLKAILPEDITKERTLNGMVLPPDMDFMLHMNNSKYLREMDFGRIHALYKCRLNLALTKLKGTFGVSAISIRYRRSLSLWQRFTLRTRITHWEKDSLYMEQRFIGSGGFIYTVAFVKIAIRQTTVPEVIKEMTGLDNVESPHPTPEMVSWMKSIQQSSEALKKERAETEKER